MPDFKKGDWVIGTEEASEHYSITKTGWVGVVQYVSSIGGSIRVCEPGIGYNGYTVSPNYFKPLFPCDKVTYPYAVGDRVIPSGLMNRYANAILAYMSSVYERGYDSFVVTKRHKNNTVDIVLVNYDGRMDGRVFTVPTQLLERYKDPFENFSGENIFDELFGESLRVVE